MSHVQLAAFASPDSQKEQTIIGRPDLLRWQQPVGNETRRGEGVMRE